MLTPLAERIQEVDYPSFAPAGTGPYVSMGVTGCHPNFVERPDGSLMFSASMRYAEAEDYGQEDQSRPGIRDVLIRSTVRSRTGFMFSMILWPAVARTVLLRLLPSRSCPFSLSG